MDDRRRPTEPGQCLGIGPANSRSVVQQGEQLGQRDRFSGSVPEAEVEPWLWITRVQAGLPPPRVLAASGSPGRHPSRRTRRRSVAATHGPVRRRDGIPAPVRTSSRCDSRQSACTIGNRDPDAASPAGVSWRNTSFAREGAFSIGSDCNSWLAIECHIVVIVSGNRAHSGERERGDKSDSSSGDTGLVAWHVTRKRTCHRG